MKILDRKKKETERSVRSCLTEFTKRRKLTIPQLAQGFEFILDILGKVMSDYPFSEADYDRLLASAKQVVRVNYD